MRAIAFCTLILSSLAAGRLFADDAYLKSTWEDSTIADASPASSPRPNVPVQTSKAGSQSLELRQAADVAANDVAPAVDLTSTQTVPANAATYVHTSTDPELPAAASSSAASSLVNLAPANPAAPPTSTTQTSSLVPANKPPPAAGPAPAPAPAPALAPAPAQPAAPIRPEANAIVASIASITTTPTLPPLPGVTGDDYVSVQWVETWVGGTSRTWVPKTLTIHFASRTPGPSPGSGRIGLGTIKGEAGQTKTIFHGAAATQAAGWARGVAAAVGVGVVGLVV